MWGPSRFTLSLKWCARYFFATEEHKKLFEQNPHQYLTQYCGYYACGVAPGALFPVDISTWQMRNGNL